MRRIQPATSEKLRLACGDELAAPYLEATPEKLRLACGDELAAPYLFHLADQLEGLAATDELLVRRP
ncbi:hypothetical protein OEZ85_004662 [Tetradesmus obliquus]|uniref:Uncharacterized protein n=1 Tax=Tetradesmus obliquus TaxID=3088 RepID=A0ABY8UM39_TETOB|nr:hypothetical protein OEZ85_004662 [Tetradesmus obliquus]